MRISKAKTAEFIANLPESYSEFEDERSGELYEKLCGMDQIHLKIYWMKHGFTARQFCFKKTEEGFFAGIRQVKLNLLNKKAFLSSSFVESMSCENGQLKFYGTYLLDCTKKLFKLAGIKWLDEMDGANINKPLQTMGLNHITIVKDIIEGKAYNFESYFHSCSMNIYKMKINWKVFKEYSKLYDHEKINTNILKDCTDNVELAMKFILENKDKKEIDLKEIKDMCMQAVVLDKKVNFKWSVKRMKEEHQKMTDEIMSYELEDKGLDSIHETPVEEKNIHLLNNEAEVFAEGTKMHHCIYTNYYKSIKNGKYLGYHMSFPEDCTFGVRLSNDFPFDDESKKGEPVLDQIYLKYDKPVQNETREIALEFIKKNSTAIKKLLSLKGNSDNCETEEVMPF